MPEHDPQMLKGVLSLLLLQLISQAETYGYELVTQLRAVGFDELGEGTVYPALTRLENSGSLEAYLMRSTSGPARKYYRITEVGLVDLSQRQASWDALRASVQHVTEGA